MHVLNWIRSFQWCVVVRLYRDKGLLRCFLRKVQRKRPEPDRKQINDSINTPPSSLISRFNTRAVKLKDGLRNLTRAGLHAHGSKQESSDLSSLASFLPSFHPCLFVNLIFLRALSKYKLAVVATIWSDFGATRAFSQLPKCLDQAI